MAQLPFLQELYGLAALPPGELVALALLGALWTAAVHGLRWITARDC